MTTIPFHPDYILSNRYMYGFDTSFNVEHFLEERKSPLLKYRTPDGESVPELINRACNIDKKVTLANTTFQGINQRWVLATIQKESSGISQELSKFRMDRLLGFGVPDKSPVKKQTLGFENQIKYAAKRLFDYADPEFQKKRKIGVGKPFQVDELLPGRRYVHPVNQATLSSYLYTPWVGDTPYRGEKTYGNLLFFNIWVKYFGTPY